MKRSPSQRREGQQHLPDATRPQQEQPHPLASLGFLPTHQELAVAGVKALIEFVWQHQIRTGKDGNLAHVYRVLIRRVVERPSYLLVLWGELRKFAWEPFQPLTTITRWKWQMAYGRISHASPS